MKARVPGVVRQRDAKTAGAASESYAYDALSNQLLSVAVAGGLTRTLGYSAFGNMDSDDDGAGTVRTLAYDSADRLVSVSDADS